MGVTTAPDATGRVRRLRPGWTSSPAALRRLALASVIANIVIVVTGGAVRLSNSGLGCPTWPQCNDNSLVPTPQNSFHGVIEFTNRQLTFVLVIIAIVTWLVAVAQHTERRLATYALLGIPLQAVVGGITVLTHLNPWVVACHFLTSMLIIAITFTLWWRLRSGVDAPALPPPTVRVLTRLTAAATVVVLMAGTVVTGSGPHAGDTDANGHVHRTGLNVASMAQLHADTVMVLIGLTVGLVVLAHAMRLSPAFRRSTHVLLGIELAQGVIGYTQYFLHVPALLVGFHMFGACLVWVAALRVLLQAEPRAVAARPAAVTAAA